jgi:plastocyanin
VGQADKKFSPDLLTIKAGDTITFVNDDHTVHNIYSETPGHEFEIKRQTIRQSNTVQFTKPGSSWSGASITAA